MKRFIPSRRATLLAYLLSLPTATFLLLTILKYQWGLEQPFDRIYPLLQNLGLQEALGWNINLLLVGGPLASITLSLLQVLSLSFKKSVGENGGDPVTVISLCIRRHSHAWTAAGTATILILVLALYFLGENCYC